MTLKCPICKKPVSTEDPYMPFCSPECKQRDLGNWATGRYVISTPADPEFAELERKQGPPGEH